MANKNDKTSEVGLVVRYRHWFRSSLDTSNLPELASSEIDAVKFQPLNVFRTRILVGRGPIQRELFSVPQLWFNHGEEAYPTFNTPNTGPCGAGLFATHKKRQFEISENEAACAFETSIVCPVSDDFLARHKSERAELPPDAPNDTASCLMLDAQRWVEQAVGLYALYQYPYVWEPIATEPIACVVNLAEKTLTNITKIGIDHQIPFRLNAGSKLNGIHLIDGATINIAKLEKADLHLPLLLLQRTLWQKNPALRFLEAFWLIDYMTSLHNAADSERQERERMYSLMSDFFAKEHPEFNARVQSLKHVFLQAPQRSRMQAYFAHLGIPWDADLMRRITTLRNALAHARNVAPTELAITEGSTVLLARKVMQLELQARGFDFSCPRKDSVP